MKTVQVCYEKDFSPTKRHPGDVGWDLQSRDRVVLERGLGTGVKTGVRLCMPKGVWAELRSRSGLALSGVVLLGGVGTIDTDYRGEIIVPMSCLWDRFHVFEVGDRVAQIVFMPDPWIKLEEVDSIPITTDRADGGFGSTGA